MMTAAPVPLREPEAAEQGAQRIEPQRLIGAAAEEPDEELAVARHAQKVPSPRGGGTGPRTRRTRALPECCAARFDGNGDT